MPSQESHPPPSVFGPWPKHVFWAIPGYLALGTGAFLLAPAARSLSLNLLNTLVFLQAGAYAFGRSRREPVARGGWKTLGLGLAAQAINQGWATLSMVLRGCPPPFPSWGDLFSLLSLALIASALLAWPLASASGSERLRKGMDGLGAAMSTFFVGWYFALGPLFGRSGSSALDRWTMAAFFMGNATILGTCAYLGARRTSRFRGPLGWIALGFTVSLVQIIFQVPLALVGRYRLGDPLDLLVLVAALLLLLAPLAPVPLEPASPPDAEIQDRSPSALLLPALPASTALALVAASLAWAPARLDTPVLAMATCLAGLGLFRGMLALRDLQRLSASLETRVAERTGDLETMQEAMLRTERMNAMAVLGAGMAHDLNNALATVRACAELALARLEEGRPPEAKDLDHLLVAADQSAALTRRLMMYGHAEDGRPTRLCLRDELAHMETILRMLIGRRISLRLELGDDRIPILGSRAQIEQIFVNLVANARDAMPGGGTITLRLSRVVSEGEPLARVEVQDTGEGMAPDIQAQIFTPFFTTKGPGRGTGLGLASVCHLMEELGGSLAVTSQQGAGTTFTLRLPLAEG